MTTINPLLSETNARIWLTVYERQRKADETEPCRYGHFHCSTRHGGHCMDEVLSNYPELADEE